MKQDAPARGAVVCEDEESAGAHAVPPDLMSNSRAEARLAIERREHALEIRDDRLRFNEQQHATRPMPCEHVDRTALAVNGERDFGHALPSEIPEPPNDLLDKAGVIGIEQPIDGFTVEVETNGHASAKDCR